MHMHVNKQRTKRGHEH